MEKKELRVNAGKTKFMICGAGLNLLANTNFFVANALSAVQK